MSRTFATANERLPRLRRLIEDSDVACPAGCPANAGQGVHCRIVGQTVDARKDPTSVANRCLSDNPAAGPRPAQPGYQGCDAWRASREADLDHRRLSLGA
jgi:hypothetical protein